MHPNVRVVSVATTNEQLVRVHMLRQLERQLAETLPERTSALSAVRDLLAEAGADADADAALMRDPNA
jgi:hypothetical protein